MAARLLDRPKFLRRDESDFRSVREWRGSILERSRVRYTGPGGKAAE